MAGPPPPPAPPPPMFGGNLPNAGSTITPVQPPAAAPGRDALLSDIRKGAKLKKAHTVDKSAPAIGGSSSMNHSVSVPSSAVPPMATSIPTPTHLPGTPQLGDILAGGIPKLKHVSSSSKAPVIPSGAPPLPDSSSIPKIPSNRPQRKKTVRSEGDSSVTAPPAPPPMAAPAIPTSPPPVPVMNTPSVPKHPPARQRTEAHPVQTQPAAPVTLPLAAPAPPTSAPPVPAPPAPPTASSATAVPPAPPTPAPPAPAPPTSAPPAPAPPAPAPPAPPAASSATAVPPAPPTPAPPAPAPPAPPTVSAPPSAPPAPPSISLPASSPQSPPSALPPAGGLPFLAEIQRKRDDRFVVEGTGHGASNNTAYSVPKVPLPSSSAPPAPQVPAAPAPPSFSAPSVPPSPAPPAPPSIAAPQAPAAPAPPAPPTSSFSAHTLPQSTPSLEAPSIPSGGLPFLASIQSRRDDSHVIENENSHAPIVASMVPPSPPSQNTSFPSAKAPPPPPAASEEPFQQNQKPEVERSNSFSSKGFFKHRLFSSGNEASRPSQSTNPYTNAAEIDVGDFTIEGSQDTTGIKLNNSGITVDDSKFDWSNRNDLPKPRQFLGLRKLYPSGRGSSVPLDFTVFT